MKKGFDKLGEASRLSKKKNNYEKTEENGRTTYLITEGENTMKVSFTRKTENRVDMLDMKALDVNKKAGYMIARCKNKFCFYLVGDKVPQEKVEANYAQQTNFISAFLKDV